LLHWLAVIKLPKSHEAVCTEKMTEFVRAANVGTLKGNVIPEVPNRDDPRIEELAGAASANNSPNTGFNSAPGELSNSWHWCQVHYHVDPRSATAPNVVTQTELRTSKEPVGDVIEQAREEIDRLYAIVRRQAYVVLLCNKDGVAIHHRGDETRAEDFRHWGIWLGGIWSEKIEGTNGIGTCITEQRQVLVHCGQHYRSRHSKLTCAGARGRPAQLSVLL
jgi:transcriptional regulator of acetoin/glycerol metabolism